MVLGKNKGHRYEDEVFEILLKNDLVFEGTAHEGMAGKEDAMICHHGKPYKLEIKNGLGADYGQKMFHWSKNDGWTWAKGDETTVFYTQVGVLKYANTKTFQPIKYTKPQDKITVKDGNADQKMFEDRNYVVEPNALWRYYSEKDVHYIQVGSGYGFYHLDNDVASLGTPQFNASFTLRLRAKYINHYKRKRDEDGNVVEATATPWNYQFFSVLRVRSKPMKSKYSLTPEDEQEFPPIKP